MSISNKQRSRYIAGDHNVISDFSGQEFKRSEMSLNWKNQLVNTLREFEVKQPQLTIRPRQEKIAVQVTRTEGPDSALQDPPFTPSQII